MLERTKKPKLHSNMVSTDLENLENSWNFNMKNSWKTPKILC